MVAQNRFHAPTSIALVEIIEDHFGVTLRLARNASSGSKAKDYEILGTNRKRIVTVTLYPDNDGWYLAGWIWNPDLT